MSQAYPLQYFRLGIAGTNNNVIASGSSLAPSKHTGKTTEKWYLNYKSSGVFQIVNVSSGKVLTASGSKVTLANNSNSSSQNWKIEGVTKDYEGYYLFYKITSNADSSKSLTFTDGTGFSLTKYSGATYQKYKINLDGLEGFAANCKTSSGEKAGTIGGLFGPVVYVSTADDLEKQCNSVGAQTIVISGNINMQAKSNTRVRDNKTIVGSFKYHTIYDSHFRTNDAYGATNDSPSDNIIFRNLDMQARNVKDRILINVWSSRQIWIDHINFNSNLSFNRKGDGLDEVGKFIWLNTPYETYLDKKDRLRSPDYITISYCKMTHRYWTVAYGTQNTETTRDRTTLLYNWWNENVRRCPQLGNGSAHVYNNYYSAYGENNNGSATTGPIGGDGSEMLSQNNMFNGYTKIQALMMGGTQDPCRDDNSYLSTALNGTPSLINFTPKKKSTWNPNTTNYGYTLLNAYNTKGTDTKAFCTKYCGCFNSQSGIKYITDSDFSSWDKTTYASPFLTNKTLKISGSSSSDSGSSSSSSSSSTSIISGAAYKIKNSNSGLYLQVAGGKAANGTNVQQWGSSNGQVHDVWKLCYAGSGYYYIISCVGDGGTYALDVNGSNTGNGTNVQIYKYSGIDAQKFLLTKNSDGSYIIKTKITGGNSAIEVASASTASGANVQQWSLNKNACQNWFLEQTEDPGCVMDVNCNYEFQNVNSGMVMDVDSGKMSVGQNIQQWTSSHGKWQQWILKKISSSLNYYFIRSATNLSFCLKANSTTNGGNITLGSFNTSDSTLFFKFSKNPDGTYNILSRASKDKCLVEVAGAGTSTGNNVQQWEVTNNKCQKWKANKYTYDVNLTMSAPVIKVYKDDDCVHTVVFVK